MAVVQGDALEFLQRVEKIPVLDYSGDEIMDSSIVAEILLSAYHKKHPERMGTAIVDKGRLIYEIDRGIRNACSGKPINLWGIKTKAQFQAKFPKGSPNP